MNWNPIVALLRMAAPYLIGALLVGGIVGGFALHERQAQRDKDNKIIAAVTAERDAAMHQAQQQAVTAQVVDHYIDRIKIVHEKGATVIREVTKYVPADSCPLPAGFGVLHDAAAQGVSIPDGTSVPTGPAIPAQVVAATVADNYTTCHATEAQLIALQDWVREQAKAAH